MHHKSFGMAKLSALVLGCLTFWATQAALGQGACRQIRSACENAGFAQGAASSGNGLMLDCIAPIVHGRPQRRKASKLLPKVDSKVVAECLAENPDFGQMKARTGGGAGSSTAGTNSTGSGTAPPAASAAAPLTNSSKHPNIIFILTDDLALNLVQYMPHVLQMQKDGVTFTNYFLTDSLCCPSRSSIFTGRYPHAPGAFNTEGEDAWLQPLYAPGKGAGSAVTRRSGVLTRRAPTT